MAQTTIRINGYAYAVGCEDGQEQRLEAMAAEVDRRIENIKTATGPAGEARLLVLAALMMADELHDLKTDVGEMRKALAKAGQEAPATDPRLGRRLVKLAKRAEDIASGLEQP